MEVWLLLKNKNRSKLLSKFKNTNKETMHWKNCIIMSIQNNYNNKNQHYFVFKDQVHSERWCNICVQESINKFDYLTQCLPFVVEFEQYAYAEWPALQLFKIPCLFQKSFLDFWVCVQLLNISIDIQINLFLCKYK